MALVGLEYLFPDELVMRMMMKLKAKGGKVKQIIHLYSQDPDTLLQYLETIPFMDSGFLLTRRPIIFVGTSNCEVVFDHYLRSVSREILPKIDFCELSSVLREIKHEVEISFKELSFENDSFPINHKSMGMISFQFPKNFDFPEASSNLFNVLKQALKENIVPQPKFVDECQHVNSCNRFILYMSFTFKCPTCLHSIYDYNSFFQKNKVKNFENPTSLEAKICRCMWCRKKTYKQRPFP